MKSCTISTLTKFEDLLNDIIKEIINQKHKQNKYYKIFRIYVEDFIKLDETKEFEDFKNLNELQDLVENLKES